MVPVRPLLILAVMAVTAAAQAVSQDPVVQARARRAAQGSEGDLPPVPRAVLEPPPLPPPEAYERKGRPAAKVSLREARKKGNTKKAARPGKVVKAEGKVRKATPRKAARKRK